LLLIALWFLATALLLPFTDGEAIPPGSLLYLAWLALAAFLWLGWSWTHGGQTLGMRAWRLRLVTLESGPVTWPRALLRFLVAVPTILAGGLGLWWALWDPRRRTLYDLSAGTLVVRVPRD
jgi:uncharacterized RDD family membrane protein YckC